MKELDLREIQQASLNVLKNLTILCDELELDYFVMYGTLIGTIRHNGFIPWDDDIDIMMPRESYNKLVDYFNENNREAGELKLFNYSNNKDYPYMISRVSDTNYRISTHNEKDCGMGVFVDIYPLDYISKSYWLSLLKGRYYGYLSSLFFLSTRLGFPEDSTGIKRFVKKNAYFFAKLIGKRRLSKMLLIKSDGSKNEGYFGCLQWMTNDYKRNILHSSLLSGRDKHKFESIYVTVPKNFDKLLSDYYGDYMKLPPVEHRTPHHLYKAYKK